LVRSKTVLQFLQADAASMTEARMLVVSVSELTGMLVTLTFPTPHVSRVNGLALPRAWGTLSVVGKFKMGERPLARLQRHSASPGGEQLVVAGPYAES
jgi:hypothetical protein